MVAFPLAVLAAFVLLPTLLGLSLSFFEWDGGRNAPVFVGLRQYRLLFSADPAFAWATLNTVVFVVASVPVTVAAAFLVAVAVHARWFRGRAIARTLLFMPTIVSLAAVGFVWRWILDAQAGVLSWAVRGVATPPDWLHEGYWALASIVVVSIWRNIGFCLVLYLAALGNVSHSLYEAAALDGATRSRTIRSVTWPAVAPMTTFLLVTQTISALQVFELVFVLTGQQETDHTSVLNLLVYREFIRGELGYAAAIGGVIFALTALATAAQLLFRRRASAGGGAA